MPIKLLTKENQKSETWSGGSTTQLAIYPEDASYHQRNFQFRISKATVDSEHSDFTHLPGFSRELMILEGTFKIEHVGRYSKFLNKFETDSFRGAWETKGFGKVKDFNLMMTGGLTGSLKGVILADKENFEIRKAAINRFFGIYCVKGSLSVKAGDDVCVLRESDFILITPDNTLAGISINATFSSEAAIAEVNLPDQ